MRLLGRQKSVEELATTADDVWQVGDGALPLKAQPFLGAKSHLGRKKLKSNAREEHKQGSAVERQNLGMLKPSKARMDTAVPDKMSDLQYWQLPNPLSANPPTPMFNIPQRGPSPQTVSSTALQPQQFYPGHQSSVESMNREYYDASKQPLYVSQQTSASAVRDMALHKGPPVIQLASSNGPVSPPKPLKSAMKQTKTGVPSKRGDNVKRPKMLDLTSFFPQPKPSGGRLLSPAKFASSPSAMTDTTEFCSKDTVNAQTVRRDGGRLETYKSAPAQPRSSGSASASTPRVKIFEPDIYDGSKTNVRRPPKGIQNWFDGFDVSSDEEEQQPVELEATEPRPSVEAIPSAFSPYGGPPTPEATPTNGKSFAARLEDKVHRMERPRVTSRSKMDDSGSESSTAGGSASSAAMHGARRRDGESRLAHSRLDSQSVLSLSSETETEDANDAVVSRANSSIPRGNPSQASLNRPSIPPRKMHSVQSFDPDRRSRQTYSTGQSMASTSIKPTDSVSVLPEPLPQTVSEPSDPAAAAMRRLKGLRESTERLSRSKQHTQSRPNTAAETVLSTSSEAAHMMAVTEEEMILLELMRQKRAAMQKHSFSEGYRLALKQEQEHLSHRRESAHSTAMRAMTRRMQEEIAAQNGRKASRNESLLSEELNQSKRYSAIRKADVDKNFRLGRFLETAELPEVGKLAQMERFLMMKPSLADEIHGERPLSGTEIETGSLCTEEQQDMDDQYDEEFEEEEQASALDLVAVTGQVFSPMQRLTQQIRRSPGTPKAAEKELSDAQDDRARAFLTTSSSMTPSSIAFPSPPTTGGTGDKRGPRLNKQSPAMPEAEPLLPDVYEQNSQRPPTEQRGHSSRASSRPSKPGTPKAPMVPHIEPDPLVDPSPALPPELKEHILDHFTPSLDFAPLELPSARPGSPSLSSRPSPLTPTFGAVNPVERAPVQIAENDNAGFHYSPNHDHPTVVSPQPVAPAHARQFRHKLPPKIDTAGDKEVDRISSLSSITSAGEDVLAAWAELGGGSDAFATRRRGR